MLVKELDDKYDAEDIKKKWKELLRRFLKQEHAKASIKPSGAGTTDIYKPSWEFYELLKFVTVICDDTDETVSSITEPSKPRVKAWKQQQRDNREDRKLELFSEAVLAMKEPETSKGQNTLVEDNEVAAFANYVRLTLSKLNARKFRRAKKCIGDILFQIEESDEWEAASATPSRYHAHGRSSPAPSFSSYSSNETNHGYQQGMPVVHESMNMHSYPSMEYY